MRLSILSAALLLLPLLGGCTIGGVAVPAPGLVARLEPAPQRGSEAISRLIDHYAGLYDMPASLIHRVVRRESNYNPRARNGPYWGLMQIRVETARTMGFRGEASDLLDADTNLRYAVKYLRGAWMLADGSHDRAVGFYARGYYYDAKRRGLLEATGLRSAR